MGNSNLHTSWRLPAQSRWRWLWGGLCCALWVCSVYAIATLFIALLRVFWVCFASCFGGLFIHFGLVICHNVKVLLLFLEYLGYLCNHPLGISFKDSFFLTAGD